MALDPHKGKLIEKIELKNGLFLELLDYSKHLAGDRCFVGLLARIPIKIKLEHLDTNNITDDEFKEFLSTYGGTIYFEMKKERNFVDEKEKDQLIDMLADQFKEYANNYLGHPDLATKTVRRKFQEYQERRNWWKE